MLRRRGGYWAVGSREMRLAGSFKSRQPHFILSLKGLYAKTLPLPPGSHYSCSLLPNLLKNRISPSPPTSMRWMSATSWATVSVAW